MKITNSMLYDDMLKVFLETGTVESNSPKNRKLLYQYMERHGIKYRTEFVRYQNATKDISNWSFNKRCGWDLGRVAKWIEGKRILKEDIKDICDTQLNRSYNFDDISCVFDDNKRCKEIYSIINEKWGEQLSNDKWTPFDLCPLRTRILRIIRID